MKREFGYIYRKPQITLQRAAGWLPLLYAMHSNLLHYRALTLIPSEGGGRADHERKKGRQKKEIKKSCTILKNV